MNTELKFDRARFDAGEMPTQTRDGRKVLFCTDTEIGGEFPIVAVLESKSTVPDSYMYTTDGRLFNEEDHESVLDLVHEPKTRKLRIAVCRSFCDGYTFTTTSDEDYGDFDTFITDVRENGRLLHLLEVEVPA